ncbi:hypothetical protein K438DRAFT_1782358 [Mycena galopus ATCC 62051]|nr:hypothetical protein K438DRAFT_1782358 [Mycena galopus ATCC 62051]
MNSAAHFWLHLVSLFEEKPSQSVLFETRPLLAVFHAAKLTCLLPAPLEIRGRQVPGVPGGPFLLINKGDKRAAEDDGSNEAAPELSEWHERQWPADRLPARHRPARAPTPAPHNHDDESDENDDDEEDKLPETLFSGGARSRINVENPDAGRNRNKNCDRTARAPPANKYTELVQRPSCPLRAPPADSCPSPAAATLGSDDIPSKFVPDPDALSMALPRAASPHLPARQLDPLALRERRGA